MVCLLPLEEIPNVQPEPRLVARHHLCYSDLEAAFGEIIDDMHKKNLIGDILADPDDV